MDDELNVERLAEVLRMMRADQQFPDDGYWDDAAYRSKDGEREIAERIAREYAALAQAEDHKPRLG